MTDAKTPTNREDFKEEMRKYGHFGLVPNDLCLMSIKNSSLRVWLYIFSQPDEVSITASLLVRVLELNRKTVDECVDELIAYGMIELDFQNSKMIYLRVSLFSNWNKSSIKQSVEVGKVLKRNKAKEHCRKVPIQDDDQISRKYQSGLVENTNPKENASGFVDKNSNYATKEDLQKMGEDLLLNMLNEIKKMNNINTVKDYRYGLVESTNLDMKYPLEDDGQIGRKYQSGLVENTNPPDTISKEEIKKIDIDYIYKEAHVPALMKKDIKIDSGNDFFLNPPQLPPGYNRPYFVKERDLSDAGRRRKWEVAFRKDLKEILLKTLPSKFLEAGSKFNPLDNQVHTFVIAACGEYPVNWYKYYTKQRDTMPTRKSPLFFPWEVDSEMFAILADECKLWLRKPEIFFKKSQWTREDFERAIEDELRNALYEPHTTQYWGPERDRKSVV